MLSKKSRFRISLAICSAFVGGLMSCTSNQTTSVVSSAVNYTITDEAGDAANLKMANTPTAPF